MPHQLGKAGQALLHHLERRRWVLVPAQVADGSGYIIEECGRVLGVDQSQEWLDDAIVDDKVSHDRTVSSNVTKGQYSLLADILVRASEQLHEVRDSSTVHNSLGLVRGARGNDGQGQHNLLADILVRASEQLHEMRDSSTVHNSLGLVRGARGNDGQGPPRQPEYGDANSNDLVQT